LGLGALGDRFYDVAGAALSFAWSPEVVLRKEAGNSGFGHISFIADLAGNLIELSERPELVRAAG
jgi:hypothetical protein